MTAAEALFLKHGFKATTVRQVATQAGVSIGTVMAEGGKEALLVSVFEEWISGVHDHRPLPPEPPGSGESGARTADAITTLVGPFIDLFAANMPLARDYGAVLLRGGPGSGIFQALAATLKTEFSHVLEGHGMPPGTATQTATAIYFAYLGVLLSWAGGALDQHTVREELTSVVASLLDPEDR
ncbi:MAG: TetR/AcrR family transcriptional regulator [Arthrobacter sp.]|nr:TetR/AcrR family transcriptional regulator [Micrococcaceae bacterium]MDN5904479.1 TetR/AcrR family transcriptional regulator [Micrococcaceae bacterium]MDN6168573.1 TetR/AcrR family transcriptional regulator [Micrococcaceae bacterium]MDN6201024.1 TetR/AcrR family transcriptional regulator [Micrococcaceae bacterium]